jgi:hypothetical protein
MKRMSPADRKFWVANHYSKLFRDLTCRVGAWSRDKLLDELERRLKKGRQERCS